jgi:copper(I)-binding protein
MLRSIFSFAVAFALLAGAAQAQDKKAGDLQIGAPWARATPKGAKVGGGYLRITNTGTAPDRLTGGSSPASGTVEVHEMSMSGGVMKMRAVAGGLEIKPGETVELKPGGYHLMFMNLKQPFEQGHPVSATLNFEKAGKVDVQFSVGGMGAQGPAGAGGDTKAMPGMQMKR